MMVTFSSKRLSSDCIVFALYCKYFLPALNPKSYNGLSSGSTGSKYSGGLIRSSSCALLD